MAEEPENHTIRLLPELRNEMRVDRRDGGDCDSAAELIVLYPRYNRPAHSVQFGPSHSIAAATDPPAGALRGLRMKARSGITASVTNIISLKSSR